MKQVGTVVIIHERFAVFWVSFSRKRGPRPLEEWRHALSKFRRAVSIIMIEYIKDCNIVEEFRG